jgi:hypothetical protein
MVREHGRLAMKAPHEPEWRLSSHRACGRLESCHSQLVVPIHGQKTVAAPHKPENPLIEYQALTHFGFMGARRGQKIVATLHESADRNAGLQAAECPLC